MISENSDIEYFYLSEKISRDYKAYLNEVIVPRLDVKHGLKARDFHVLCEIANEDGAILAKHLAILMRCDENTLWRSLIALIGRKYIKSNVSGGQNKGRNLTLTAAGHDLVELYKNELKLVTSNLSDRLDPLTAEEEVNLVSAMITVQNRAQTLLTYAKQQLDEGAELTSRHANQNTR